MTEAKNAEEELIELIDKAMHTHGASKLFLAQAILAAGYRKRSDVLEAQG